MKRLSVRAGCERWLQRQWQLRGVWAWLMAPLAGLVALFVSGKALYWTRLSRPYRAPVPVIIVGNLYVGGTGKTPVTISLVRQLSALGWSPGVVSRGYGLRLGRSARVGQGQLDASQFGDEPSLIADQTLAPVAVHPERRLACEALLAAYPLTDIIVSDDGLQHLKLARDFEIVVQDDRGAGNGWLLPAGPLREKASRLKTVDLVITRTEGLNGSRTSHSLQLNLQISTLQSLTDGIVISVSEFINKFSKSNICAIAAISEPDRFFRSLSKAGIHSQRTVSLPDHAPFDSQTLADLKADVIVMTSKDAVKCRALADRRVWVAHADTLFSDPSWGRQVSDHLRSGQARAR